MLRLLACVTLISALWAQTGSLPAPSPIAPAEGAELHNFPREVWLEWAAVPRAESYTIEIDCENCCVQGRFCSEVPEGRTFRAAGLQGTKYRFEFWGDQRGRWRVWASAGFVEGEKSPWRMLSFKTGGLPSPPAAPHIIAPAANAVVPADPPEVTFEWSPVIGATSYTLEIDPQNTCAQYKYCSDVGVYRIIENITGTRYTTDVASKLWTRWRVWAVEGDRTSLRSAWTMFQHISFAAGLTSAAPPVPPPVSGPVSPIPPRSASAIPAPLINRTTPEYSEVAKAAGLEGIATVYFEIGPSGAARKVRILQGLGMGLDEKAVELVRDWRFSPPAPGVTLPVEAAEIAFRLNGTSGWRVRRVAYTIVRESRSDADGTKPVLRSYARPDAAACPTGEHNIVEVTFDIDKKGLPENVNSRGPADLRGAVLAWRFDPARMQGRERAAKATFEMECGSSSSGAMTPGGPGVTRPSILFKVDPEYSEEARKAKYNGQVAILLTVDADGFPVNLRIVQPIGFGLDEKAMEALKQWRFRPAIRDGQPVAFPITVEMSFRLL